MTPIEQAIWAMREARDFINIHATWRPPTRYDKLDAAIAALESEPEPLAEGEGELVRDGTGLCELQMDEYVEAEEQRVHIIVLPAGAKS